MYAFTMAKAAAPFPVEPTNEMLRFVKIPIRSAPHLIFRVAQRIQLEGADMEGREVSVLRMYCACKHRDGTTQRAENRLLYHSRSEGNWRISGVLVNGIV